jgi:hypothetical protein
VKVVAAAEPPTRSSTGVSLDPNVYDEIEATEI